MGVLDRYETAPAPDGSGVLGPCHLWTGPVNSSGYGTVTLGDRRLMAHRAAWEAYHGPIPDGHDLDHLCRRRLCIAPLHLEPVTPGDNQRRKPTRGRVFRGDVCPMGHPLAGANRIPGGECRRCNSAR